MIQNLSSSYPCVVIHVWFIIRVKFSVSAKAQLQCWYGRLRYTAIRTHSIDQDDGLSGREAPWHCHCFRCSQAELVDNLHGHDFTTDDHDTLQIILNGLCAGHICLHLWLCASACIRCGHGNNHQNNFFVSLQKKKSRILWFEQKFTKIWKYSEMHKRCHCHHYLAPGVKWRLGVACENINKKQKAKKEKKKEKKRKKILKKERHCAVLVVGDGDASSSQVFPRFRPGGRDGPRAHRRMHFENQPWSGRVSCTLPSAVKKKKKRRDLVSFVSRVYRLFSAVWPFPPVKRWWVLELGGMAETPPSSSGGEAEVELGRETVHGRNLVYLTGSDGKHWFPLGDVLQAFFLGPGESRSVLQRRMNALNINRVPATKEQMDVLHRTGASSQSTRFKLILREDMLKLLAYKSSDLPADSLPQSSDEPAASQETEPEATEDSSVPVGNSKAQTERTDDAEARLKRVLAMLKSDLVGRDVNCMQPARRDDERQSASSSAGGLTSEPAGDRHRSAGHVTGITRTRIVKRPRRHDGFISLDGGGAESSSESDTADGRIRHRTPRKRKYSGPSNGISAPQTPAPATAVSEDEVVDVTENSSAENPRIKLVLRRQSSAPNKRPTWSKSPSCAASQPPEEVQLPPPPVRAPPPTQAPPTQAPPPVQTAPSQPKRSHMFAARKTVSTLQKPSSHTSRKSKGFSLAQAIPTPPVLMVYEDDLIPACSLSVNMAERGLPPPSHPLWTWSLGQTVDKEYLIKTADVAWRSRSVVVRRRQQ